MRPLSYAPEDLELPRDPLHLIIAARLEGWIAREHFSPGNQLPSDRDLAEQFGVSRVTVQKALLLLKQRGLVEIKPGSGTFVTSISAETVARSIERYAALGSARPEDLLVVRFSLEPTTAALAATHATPDEIQELLAASSAIDDAYAAGELDRAAEADAAFHVVLARASHNPFLAAILGGLELSLAHWIRATASPQLYDSEGFRNHKEICRAIAAHDPTRAREAMERNLSMIVISPELSGPSP
jgi:GntR family transcriptional repressor for pyruvate dehydrogenase complex